MAWPPSLPGSQASRIAGTFSAAQPMLSGRPFKSTSTTGLPSATTALSSSSCRPGRSSEAREAASPAMSAFSPSTITINIRIARRGHSRLEGSLGLLGRLHGLLVDSRHHLVEKRYDVAPDLGAGGVLQLSLPAAWRAMPSSTVTAAGVWPKTIHEPSVASIELARGPITATFFRSLGERQEPAFVPQQHHRTLRSEACFLAVLRQCDNLRQLRLVGVRMLEEPHPNLDGKDGPHCRLDIGQLQCAVLDEPGQVLRVMCRWPCPC